MSEQNDSFSDNGRKTMIKASLLHLSLCVDFTCRGARKKEERLRVFVMVQKVMFHCRFCSNATHTWVRKIECKR